MIDDVGLDRLEATSHGIGNLTLDFDLGDVESVPSFMLTRKYGDLTSCQADAFQDTAADLRRTARIIDELLQGHAPFAEFESIIGEAQESLTGDLNQFFQNVELYRSGVFSHATKESIATLGIGAKLDELESEFTDDHKSAFTAEATGDLFPGFTELTVKAAACVASLSSKVRTLLESLRALKIERPGEVRTEITDAASAAESSFHGEISRQLRADAERLREKVILSLASLSANAKASYDSEMKSASATRRLRYFWIITATSVLVLSAYLGYRHLASTAPQSVFQTIVWGLISTLGGDVVVFVVARFRDNFDETTKKIKERHGANLRQSVRKAIDSEMQSHEFEALNEESIGGRLRAIYAHILLVPTDPWHARATEYLREIREQYAHLAGVRAAYLSSIDEIHRQAAQYFTDASKNLYVLNEVANKIKERAIQGSFQLLEDTQKQLEYVKKDIEAVDFS
jgi:hypothetical protein